jgi:hypothetical protein
MNIAAFNSARVQQPARVMEADLEALNPAGARVAQSPWELPWQVRATSS